MTTEMKQLLALLLMGCVFTVHGEAGAERDPCTSGRYAQSVYIQYKGCSGSAPHDYVPDYMSWNPITVDSFIRFFANYCSTVFPKLGPCFQKNIENCTSSQRNSLMSVANHTGFACEPNTNRTHPVFQHLFSRLTSADLNVTHQCFQGNASQMRLTCHNRSLEAAGMSLANFSEVVSRLSIEDLVPKFQAYVKTSMNCTVTNIRDNPGNCSAWRGKALFLIRNHLIPSELGKNMTFTTADVDTMFGWPVL